MIRSHGLGGKGEAPDQGGQQGEHGLTNVAVHIADPLLSVFSHYRGAEKEKQERGTNFYKLRQKR